MIFVGIDWASKEHTIHVLDHDGQLCKQLQVPHSGDGFAQLARQLHELEPQPQHVHVGIESHNGPLMDWLHNQAYSVYPINPKSAAKGRGLFRASDAKDDPFDAETLARLVFMKVPRPSPRLPDGQPHQTLEDLLRFRENLVQEKSDLLRRLGALLQTWAPTLAALCVDLDSRWQRDLLRRWPLCCDLQNAHPNTLTAFAKKHRLAAKTRARLTHARQQTPVPILPARQDILRWEIHRLLDRLERVLAELDEVGQTMTVLTQADPRAPLVASLPAVGPISQAALLVALSQAEARGDDWRSLAAYTGMAPVTKQSGKYRLVRHRRACDHLLRRLLTYYAFQTILQSHCWASEDYKRRRAKGASHHTALRAIGRRWIKIACAVWRTQTPYSEEYFRQAQKRHTQRAA